MGYKILYGNELLLDSCTDDVVTDTQLTSSINTASYFDFTIAPTHSLYNTVAERAELVSVYFNKIKLFSGEITEIELDLEGYKSITCTGVLDYLGDTVVRPYSTIEGEEDLTAPSSVDGYFQWLIDQHNEHCLDARKQFSVGVNQGNMLDDNNYIYRASSQRPTTASEIENKILDSLGGYLFVRYENDLNILDFYADAHEANTQIIDFGVNITDFTKTTATDDQYTAVVATGYTPDPPEDDPDKEMDPITLEGCTDGGTAYSPTIIKQGDRVYDIDAVARYGYKEYYASNDEIETYDGLLEYACKTLNSLLSPYLTVTVKAVDLAMYMDNGYEHLQLGQAARVRSKPHGLDEYLMVNSIVIDVNDPGNTEYTLGAGYDTLTGQQSSYLKSLNANINSALDATGALSAETKAAAKNAQTALDTSEVAKEAADKAVVSSVPEYAQSDSAVEVPAEESWSTVPPAWVDGKYIWMRYVITYGSGTIETTAGVVLTGNTGAQGIQGIQGENGKDGVQGPPGVDGATTYFHIKYSPVENPTASQMTETPDIYIGTYVDTTKEDSTDPGDYTWARFQGLQGEKGERGIPGIGEDGRTSYLHIKYSNDGKTFTGNDGEDPGDYIGQYTDFTELDSKVFSDYNWSKIKGDQGENGDDGVSPTVDTSKSGTTTTITIVDAEGTKTATIEDGSDGVDGKGVKSTAISYKASTSGTTVPSGTWSTSIPTVTKGQYLWTRTITTYTDASTSTGYSVAYQPIDGDDGTSVTINTTAITYQASASGTTVPTGTWSATIPTVDQGSYLWTKTVVTYSDGKSTTSYSVSYKGVDGDSVTIKSTAVTYQTSTSGTTVPTGTWSTTIPSVTKGQYLWTRTVVTYSPSGSTTSYSVAYQAKDGENGDDGKMLYGTCSTAGATAAKVASVTGFTLTKGTAVSITFTYANSADAPTLNINSLGAKKIFTNGVQYAYWADGAAVTFMYDGTQFQVCSTPVYANTVTVGNPTSQNVYIDSDGIDFRDGTEVNASFTSTSGYTNLNGTKNLMITSGTNADPQAVYFSIPPDEEGWESDNGVGLLPGPTFYVVANDWYVNVGGGIRFQNTNLLWSGSLSKGGSITNALVLKYSCYLIHTNKWEPMIGIRSPISRSNPYYSGTGDTAYIITAFNSWDDGSSSYLGKATLTVSSAGKVTLISASSHLMSSGVDGTSLTLEKIYGLF